MEESHKPTIIENSLKRRIIRPLDTVLLRILRVYNTVINRPFEEILILPVVRIHPLINQISWNMSLAVWRQNQHRRCASPPSTD